MFMSPFHSISSPKFVIRMILRADTIRSINNTNKGQRCIVFRLILFLRITKVMYMYIERDTETPILIFYGNIPSCALLFLYIKVLLRSATLKCYYSSLCRDVII